MQMVLGKVSSEDATSAAGIIVFPHKEQPKVPPHQPPIIEPLYKPEPGPPEPCQPEKPDAKLGLIDQLADGFHRIPPGPFAYYRIAL